MSLPTGRQDMTGNLTTNLDLGLTGTLTASQTQTGNNINTVAPQTVTLLIAATPGADGMTVKVSVNSGSPSFGSPTVTKSLASGLTSLQTLQFNTTSSNLNYAVQLVDGGSGSTVQDLACLTLAQMSQYEGWHDATSALNAVESSVTGNGSGTFSIAIIA